MVFLNRKKRYLIFTFFLAAASCLCMVLVSFSISRRIAAVRKQFSERIDQLERHIAEIESRPPPAAPAPQAPRGRDGGRRAEAAPAYVLHVGQTGKWWYADIRWTDGTLHRAFFRNQAELNQVLRISYDTVHYSSSESSEFSSDREEIEDF